jgi:O-antigen/teichoic acid export membrane protein
VVLNTLGAEDYGIYNVVGGIVAMLSFLNSAMSSASMRFIVYELGVGNTNKLQDTFCVICTICFLFGGVCLIILECVGFWFLNYKMNIDLSRLNAANWVLQFSIISFFITIISVPYNAIIIAYEKMNVFAYISILEAFLKLGIVFILSFANIDKLKLYAVLVCLVAIFLRFVYSLYCKKQFTECKTYRFLFDKQLFKSIFEYTGWSLYGNLAHVSYLQGLNILLNLFFGVKVNAARAIAMQVQSSVTQFINNFQVAANPQIIKYYAQKDYANSFKLVFWSSKISFFMLFLLSIPLIKYNELILNLWLKTVPDYVVIFCQLALVVSLISVITLPFSTVVQATGKLKMNSLIVGTCNLLILPVSYIFLRFGFPPETVFYINIFCNRSRGYWENIDEFTSHLTTRADRYRQEYRR